MQVSPTGQPELSVHAVPVVTLQWPLVTCWLTLWSTGVRRRSHQLLSPTVSPSSWIQYCWHLPGKLPAATQSVAEVSLISPVCQTPPPAAPGNLVCHPQPPSVFQDLSKVLLPLMLRSSFRAKLHVPAL